MSNGFRLFGYRIGKEEDTAKKAEDIASFAPPSNEDGAFEFAPGGSYGTFVDLEGTAKNEAELVTKYRELALQSEVETALEDIVNEAITYEDFKTPIELDLTDVKVSEKVKERIREEFGRILELMDFSNKAHDIFRRWYIDGRIYYHMMISEKSPGKGIQELRYIDPRRIRKVREAIRKPPTQPSPVQKAPAFKEYYMYTNPNPTFGAMTTHTGVRIAKDSIAYAHSGLMDAKNRMVLSYLHKAIKPMNQLRMLEDATVIYRLSRAPERRIFYIDVGNLPKMKAEQYIRDMMVKHKNRLVYDASTGEVRDDRKFMCFAMDTKIPLLDGRTVTLQNLISEYEQEKQNWVYSCDPVTGKFVPGPVSWAGVTKKNAEVVRVTFDNGKSVVCTPDHKFPVWGKGFVEAKDLVGESIIPGYRRMNKMFGDSEYEQIYKNDTQTWEYTHREVARWKDQNGIREEKLHKLEYAEAQKRTIHHVNFNNLDNSPSNLTMMNRDDHMHYHWDCAKYGFNGRVNKSEDFTPEWRAKISKARRGRVHHCKTWKIFAPDGSEEIVQNLNEYCRRKGLNRSNIKYNHSRGYRAEVLRNHKAVSVEWLDENIDVGCITVDLAETYHSHHTYLLDAGVYTKNTMLEDFWLPRREGGRGTEITTLPGGQNLGEMEDVEYFRRKLFRALNVPVTRIQAETTFSLGRGNEITRDEVKFSKFISRLRMRFASLFDELLRTQLLLRGVLRKEEWEDIKEQIHYDFRRDNYYAELKEQEITTARMTIAQNFDPFVGKYVSAKYIREKILKLTDEEIVEIDKEMEEERQKAEAAQQEQMMAQQQTGQTQSPDQAQQQPQAQAQPVREEEELLLQNVSRLIEETLSNDK